MPRKHTHQIKIARDGGNLLFILYFLTYLTEIMSFNIAPEASYIASFPNDVPRQREAYFGYSVGIIKTNRTTWLLAGAPRANSSSSRGVVEPGAFFKCPVNQPTQACKEVVLDYNGNFVYIPSSSGIKTNRDNSWIGASMDVDKEGNAIICAPRWKNAYYDTEYRISGACYNIGADFREGSALFFSPLTKPALQQYRFYGISVYYYAHGQYGFDVHITKNQNMLVGSPGVLNWQGSVSTKEHQPQLPSGGISKRQAYGEDLIPNPINTTQIQDSNFFGYAVTSGRFGIETDPYYVAGAPRGAGSNGMAMIFRVRPQANQPLYIKEWRQGTQLGEYFGASVAAPDLDGNGFSDLVAGAPMHSLDGLYDVGCVYVFMNDERKPSQLSDERIQLFGDVEKAARFGTALGTPGDLDNDGYDDLLVGAPYENDYAGAVYVYMGSINGVRKRYDQKLTPEKASSTIPLKGFGISFSRPSDVDNNMYPDFAVGSFLSDNAALMLTRPVINVIGEISSYPTKLSLTQDNFTVIPCIFYDGIGVPNLTAIKARITLSQESESGEVSVSFSDTGSTEKEFSYLAVERKKQCQPMDVNLKLSRNNAQKPVIIRMNFWLRGKDKYGKDDPIISPHVSNPPNLVLSFITGCENDICNSDLNTFAKFKGFDVESKLLIGEINDVSLEISVMNRKDPAFLPNITITIPHPIVMRPTLHECVISQETNTTKAVCQLQNPLKRFEKDTLKFVLDTSQLDDTSPDVQVSVYADSAADVELNEDDNYYTLPLEVEKKASIAVTGWSRPEQSTYERYSKHTIKTNGTLQIEHVFSIVKNDVTPLREVVATVRIPTIFKTEDGKEIILINQTQNELTFHTKSQSCDIQGPKADTRMFSKYENIEVANEIMENGGGSITSFNCSFSRVKCTLIKCRVGPWKKSYDVASLTVKFTLNFSAISNLISVAEGFSLYSSVDVKIASHEYTNDIIGQRQGNTTVQTMFQPGSLPAESLEWWIYLLAVLGGLLLLLVIAFILYKIGFFKRKTKEDLKAQKATLVSQDENQR